MGIFEIISAIVLIIACVFIVIVVLINDTKSGMSQAISGASSDSFYQKNSGRTKEAKLNRAMVAATVIFFVLAFAVNIINVHFGKPDTDDTNNAQNNIGVSTSTAEAGTLEADISAELHPVDPSTVEADNGTETTPEADTTTSTEASAATTEANTATTDAATTAEASDAVATGESSAETTSTEA